MRIRGLARRLDGPRVASADGVAADGRVMQPRSVIQTVPPFRDAGMRRQSHAHGRSDTDFRGHLNRAVVVGHDAVHDREPKACPRSKELRKG